MGDIQYLSWPSFSTEFDEKRNNSLLNLTPDNRKSAMKSVYYSDILFSDLENMKDRLSFLIVTATDIETESVHRKLEPFPKYNAIIQTFDGNQTYYIGVFGAYAIVHVQCTDMGSVATCGAINTVRDAIACWKPKAVVMIGIAYGMNSKKQNIGDVLVSKTIIPYEIRRIGESVVYRNPIPPGGTVLLNRFRNARTWNHDLPDGKKAKYTVCQLLSGEALIDNLEFRDKLSEDFPDAKGGEMEGAGLYAAAHSKRLEWLVVKGICDYADGNKSENRDNNQKIAAEAATSLCLNVFSSEIAFESLDFVPIRPYPPEKTEWSAIRLSSVRDQIMKGKDHRLRRKLERLENQEKLLDEKLRYLQNAHDIKADGPQKFELRKETEQCQKALEEVENKIDMLYRQMEELG